MNAQQIIRNLKLTAIVLIACFTGFVNAEELKNHNAYTVLGHQLRSNLITQSPFGDEKPVNHGPTLFQEIRPCRFISTLEDDKYPAPWGGKEFNADESRTYYPIGVLRNGDWVNPCSEIVDPKSIAVALRIMAFDPDGNGAVYLAPSTFTSYSYPAVEFQDAVDAMREADVALHAQSFRVQPNKSTHLVVDIIGYFWPDPNGYGAAGPKGEDGEKGEKGEQGQAGAQGLQGERGEKGEKGEQGQAGAQGLKGDKGENGERGEAGAQGLKGDKGEAGAQGLKGDKGENGQRGEAGAQGLKGDKGDRGEAGAQGLKGDKGENGQRGEAGAQGLKGDKGENGQRGEAGAQGLKGDKGENGQRGEAGAQGLKGDKGERGERGEAGAQGLKGDKGENGQRGEAGAQGLKGDKGERGERGEAGAQGSKGDKGERGERGEAGAQGSRGDKGERGEAGAQGSKGDMGPMGPQGPAGTNGGGVSMITGTSIFQPGGRASISHSGITTRSVILLIYIDVSNGNALGTESQTNGSFVATGSPNKPFRWVAFNMN